MRRSPLTATATGPIAGLADSAQFAKLMRRLQRHDRVVYGKPAFGGPLRMLRYLELVPEAAAGSFKANCLAVMDEVQAKHETVVITKRGKPVAKLVPLNTEPDEICNFLAGKGTITGDIVSPAVSPEEWGKLK